MWLLNNIGLILLSMGVVIVGLLTILYIKTIFEKDEEPHDTHINTKRVLMRNKGKA